MTACIRRSRCPFLLQLPTAHVRVLTPSPNVSILVVAGMQSAALGFMLAQAHFADALVAVPSAVSVVFMVSPCSERASAAPH